MKEKDDDLSLFLELRNREIGRNDLSVNQIADEFDDSLGMYLLWCFSDFCDFYCYLVIILFEGLVDVMCLVLDLIMIWWWWYDMSVGLKPKITATMCGDKEQNDEFLDSENDKTDYDW